MYWQTFCLSSNSDDNFLFFCLQGVCVHFTGSKRPAFTWVLYCSQFHLKVVWCMVVIHKVVFKFDLSIFLPNLVLREYYSRGLHTTNKCWSTCVGKLKFVCVGMRHNNSWQTGVCVCECNMTSVGKLELVCVNATRQQLANWSMCV